MYTPKLINKKESKENWVKNNKERSRSFVLDSETSSSCPNLNTISKKISKSNISIIPRKRLLSSEVNKSIPKEVGYRRRVSQNLTLSSKESENDFNNLYDFEIILHKMECKFIRLQLELEENKSELVKVSYHNQLLRNELGMLITENALLRATEGDHVTSDLATNDKPMNEIGLVVISEPDDEPNHPIDPIGINLESAKPCCQALNVRRRLSLTPDVTPGSRLSRASSPNKSWENSLVLINRAMEETDVVELRKLLLASIVESQVHLTRLEEAENRRQEILNQAEKSHSDLNEKILRLEALKHISGLATDRDELRLARGELRSAQERVNRLEFKFDEIKTNLDQKQDSRRLPQPEVAKTPKMNSVKSILYSTINFAKDILTSHVYNGTVTLDSTPVIASTNNTEEQREIPVMGEDVLKDMTFSYDVDREIFNNSAKFQASTPKKAVN